MSDTLTDRIANKISAWIVSGRFAPGEKLPRETDLAERFGVSRPTIRNALRQVAGRGLTASRRGSGHTVQRWWTTAAPDVLAAVIPEIDPYTEGGRLLISDLLTWRQELWVLLAGRICLGRNEAVLARAGELIDALTDPRTMVGGEPDLLDLYAAAQTNTPLRMSVAATCRTLKALYQRLEPVPSDPTGWRNGLVRIHRAIEMGLQQDVGQLVRSHCTGFDNDLKRALLPRR